MRLFSIFIAVLFSVSSCGLLDEKEPEILLSQVDGEQYMEDMQSEINSRKDTRLIEDGLIDKVGYESLLNLADSLTSKNDEWRPRYFHALNDHLTYTNFNIDEKDNQRFGIGIFNYFLFYPSELIELLNSSSMAEIDFWDKQLSLEINRKEKFEDINKETIINVAQENCKECSPERLELIASMVNNYLTN
jgi:hypothetical protein